MSARRVQQISTHLTSPAPAAAATEPSPPQPHDQLATHQGEIDDAFVQKFIVDGLALLTPEVEPAVHRAVVDRADAVRAQSVSDVSEAPGTVSWEEPDGRGLSFGQDAADGSRWLAGLGDNPSGTGWSEEDPEMLSLLQSVFEAPNVRAACEALLGPGYVLDARSPPLLHTSGAGRPGQNWHRDGADVVQPPGLPGHGGNRRHHVPRELYIMYYPQEVTPDMGPTRCGNGL
jgi:hypothetical protein